MSKIEDQTYGIAADRLRSFVERIERLEEEKRVLSGDIKDIYAEAKSAGFHLAALKRVIKERRMDPAAVEQYETNKDLYRRALGQLADTPLGLASVEGMMRDSSKASKRRVKQAITDSDDVVAAIRKDLN